MERPGRRRTIRGSTSTARAGTDAATRHLLSRGHRRIGFLGWPTGSGVGDDRREGWRRALAEVGLGPAGLFTETEDDVAPGERAARKLLDDDPEITALVCASDSLALGALHVARAPGPAWHAGGHPHRPVAVVGFDDTPVAKAIGLTSVRQPLGEVASSCLRLLAHQLDGGAGASPSTSCFRPPWSSARRADLLPTRLHLRTETKENAMKRSNVRKAALSTAVGAVLLSSAACGGSGFEETDDPAAQPSQASAGPAQLQVLIGSSGDAETKAVTDAAAAWGAATGNTATVTPAQDLGQQLGQALRGRHPARRVLRRRRPLRRLRQRRRAGAVR